MGLSTTSGAKVSFGKLFKSTSGSPDLVDEVPRGWQVSLTGDHAKPGKEELSAAKYQDYKSLMARKSLNSSFTGTSPVLCIALFSSIVAIAICISLFMQ